MDELFSKAIDALDLNEFPESSSASSSSTAPAAGSIGGGMGGSGSAGGSTVDLLARELMQGSSGQQQGHHHHHHHHHAADDVISVPPSAVEAARRVLAAWEEIDLEGRKAGWDEVGLGISANQETSTRNRRSLAEQTKAFKSAGGQHKDFAGLLKAYQAEIDSLTKRAKHAETAWLGTYQLLYDAPDVLPILRSFCEVSARVASAEQETRRLRQELEVVRGDAANAKGLHAQIRRLEERNAELEDHLDDEVAKALEEKEEEMREDLKVAEERENALKQRIAELADNVASLQKLNDGTQSALFDCKAKMEEVVAAKQNELDAVMEELEQYQERLTVLERAQAEATTEAQRLRQAMSAAGLSPDGITAHGGSGAAGAASLDGLGEAGDLGVGAGAAIGLVGEKTGGGEDNDVAVSPSSVGAQAQARLVSKLHAELQQLEQSLAMEREARAADTAAVEERLAQEAEEKSVLKKELEARPTHAMVDELRKQIRILQALVGADVYEEWTSSSSGKSASAAESKDQRQGSGAAGRGKEEEDEESEWQRIQAAFKESNKRLMAELTAARTAVAQKSLEAEEAQAKVVALESQTAQLKALVAKLEDDIVKGSGTLRDLLVTRGKKQQEQGQQQQQESWSESGSAAAMAGLLGADTSAGEGAAAASTGTFRGDASAAAAAPTDAGAEGDAANGGATGGVGVGGTRGGVGDESMLLIVCDQRERFRKRVKELEEENGKLQEALGKANLETQRLTNDNIELYEKMKFLEHYNRQTVPMRKIAGGGLAGLDAEGGGSSGSGSRMGSRSASGNSLAGVGGSSVAAAAGGAAAEVIEFAGAGVRAARYTCFGLPDGATGPGGMLVDGGASVEGSVGGGAGGAGAEVRYRKMYEEKMNPFAEFHQREQERSYRSLRLHDKITLTSSRFLLSNKYGRLFVFFYTILLHLFILFLLYRFTHPRKSLATSNATDVVAAPSTAATDTTLVGGTLVGDGSSSGVGAKLGALVKSGAAVSEASLVQGGAGVAAGVESRGEEQDEGRTFADAFAEGVGTLLQTTKELTAGRRLRRRLLQWPNPL